MLLINIKNMNIIIENKTDFLNISSVNSITSILEIILNYLNLSKHTELSVLFIDDESMRELNRKYRDINRTTDVLSFPQDYLEDTDILGDIVISIDTAKRRSKKYGITLEVELKILLIHGLLHLMGYDHKKKSEADLMQKKESELMRIVDNLNIRI